MCVALYLYDVLSKYILVVAFNRDELFERETLAAHWWTDQQGVVGGKDCVGKGTWLCTSVNGRVAFLTNVRNRRNLKKDANAPSRGELPVRFVTSSDLSPAAFLHSLTAEAEARLYSPFNLVVADLKTRPQNSNKNEESQLWYLTNSSLKDGDETVPLDEQDGEVGCNNHTPIPVLPGVHGVSNASLDTPWPKIEFGRRRLDDLATSGAFDKDEFPWEEIFAIMGDSTILETDPERLPNTGYGAEFESLASSLFVQPVEVGGAIFGTRSMTVLAVRRDGTAELRERYLTGGSVDAWAEERHQFSMDISSPSAEIFQ